ncbi:hypothetical protein C8J56DRAFT_892781 [Mycena floridula]|nr:hypothetical protein C8J56DRAFT_892781 [Mycena floridula]
MYTLRTHADSVKIEGTVGCTTAPSKYMVIVVGFWLELELRRPAFGFLASIWLVFWVWLVKRGSRRDGVVVESEKEERQSGRDSVTMIVLICICIRYAKYCLLILESQSE